MIEVNDLLTRAIEIVKQDRFSNTIGCKFEIVKEGLLPYSNKNNKSIFVPTSIVPFLQMYNLRNFDLFTSYILGHRLIESDFYEEAEGVLINLQKYSQTDKKANKLEKHYNRLITQIVFMLFHEIGHFAFDYESFKLEIFPNLKSRYARWVYITKNSEEELRRNIRRIIDYIQSRYGKNEKINKSEIESLVSYFNTHIKNIDFETMFQLNQEEYFADSYAFYSMVDYLDLFDKMNDSYFSIIEYSIIALECSHVLSSADGYLKNEYSIRDRFINNQRLINLSGNTIPRDFRISNVVLLLSDTHLYEPYEELIDDLIDGFYLKLPEFLITLNNWWSLETEKLYEGNFRKPNVQLKNKLYNDYIIVNNFLCTPFEIQFE